MRRIFEPRLVNDPFGDPGLYVDFHDERRALLFDIGDIAALPPRKLMRLTHVFVTHAHMDHFAGFDQLLRVVLGRKERIVLFGGPDFISRVEHKLQAYTWNVVHRYEVPLAIEVHEVGADAIVRRAVFSSRKSFERQPCPSLERTGDVLVEDATFRVRARFVDHELPCLAYALEEKARARVAKDRLAAMGLTTGPWLRELKRALLDGAPGETAIRVHWRDRAGEHATTRPVSELREAILDVGPGQRIGYVTDLRHSEANIETLRQLLSGVDLLFIESVFLDEDRDHALRKNHLTARQAGEIARRVSARAVVPFHFSPRYERRPAALLAEVQNAWAGKSAALGASYG
jgi:ribonuclease Z